MNMYVARIDLLILSKVIPHLFVSKMQKEKIQVLSGSHT